MKGVTRSRISGHPSKASFNPHSQLDMFRQLFQSTLPMKGVTLQPPRQSRRLCVSIHTPNEGSDAYDTLKYGLTNEFQSTLPMKGVTKAEYERAIAAEFQSTLPMKGVTP